MYFPKYGTCIFQENAYLVMIRICTMDMSTPPSLADIISQLSVIKKQTRFVERNVITPVNQRYLGLGANSYFLFLFGLLKKIFIFTPILAMLA